MQQQIIELRKQNQSIYDISDALKKEGIRRHPGGRGHGPPPRRLCQAAEAVATTSGQRESSRPPPIAPTCVL